MNGRFIEQIMDELEKKEAEMEKLKKSIFALIEEREAAFEAISARVFASE